MNQFIETFLQLWDQYIVTPFTRFNIWDALDIICLTALLYGAYLFVRGRRAGKLAVGVVLIFVFYAISDIAGLRAMHRLLAGIAPYTVILLAVVFQSELRDALEKLGSSPWGLFSGNRQEHADLSNTISEVVDAACQIAMADRDGALIVIERSTPLGEYASKGYPLDAVVTSELLCNIFVDRTPLHDGAIIIRNNRIAAAGSKLPLSVNEEVVKGMGTRHRAAVGITEVSDCVVVVVSEERHRISIANNGQIKQDYNKGSAEFQNEAGMKAIQNALRNDLFKLLVGTSFDESNEGGNGKKAKKKHRRITFRWRSANSRKVKAPRPAEPTPETTPPLTAPRSDAEAE